MIDNLDIIEELDQKIINFNDKILKYKKQIKLISYISFAPKSLIELREHQKSLQIFK